MGRIPNTAGRASSPSAGNLLNDPVIGRIPGAAGRVSSASATISGPHNAQQGAARPCYWTHSTHRRASIISISWKPSQTHSPTSGALNPQQSKHSDPVSSSTLLLLLFHAPQSEHHQHQLEHVQSHPLMCGHLTSHQDSSSILLLDGFHASPGEHHQHQLSFPVHTTDIRIAHAPQGEHHRHQLETFSNSANHYCVSEPTAG